MSQETFNIVAVVRYADDYDSMEGGGKMTSFHVLCSKNSGGRSIPFVINALNSGSVMDGTLNETWRRSVQQAGVDPVFALGAAQQLGHVLNGGAEVIRNLPEITDILHSKFPGENMPYLRAPAIAMPA